MHDFGTKTRHFDSYTKNTKDKLFIKALNFAMSQNYEYDIISLVDKYVLAYGKFENTSELLLKNIVQGNFEIVEILEKH